MGLFDNIFLDQNTPTAMLDPLLSPEEKAEQKRMQEAQEKAKNEASIEIIDESSAPLQDVNFDVPDISTDSTGASDVTFDIGGVDFDMADVPDSPEQTDIDEKKEGMFLSGGTVVAALEDAPQDAQEQEMTSIALLQGATAGSSDSIIGVQETPLGESDNVDALATAETSPIHPDDNSGDVGIFDLFGDTKSLDTESQDGTSSPESEAPADTGAPYASPEESVTAPMITGDSPLHDMLREFIGKLEQFEVESRTMNNDIDTSLTGLLEKRAELKKEFEIREQAITYEEQHLMMKRDSQKKEKARLEKIIHTLKEEVAL